MHEFTLDNNENPRHVVAIDIRGCGQSGMPEKGFSLQHMATDIEAAMMQLSIRKAHIIAYSRGVAYALQYALRNPDSVQTISSQKERNKCWEVQTCNVLQHKGIFFL